MAMGADLCQKDHVLGHECSRFRSGGHACPGCWILSILRQEMGGEYTQSEMSALAHEALTGGNCNTTTGYARRCLSVVLINFLFRLQYTGSFTKNEPSAENSYTA